jgi:hypothetical protein
VSDVYQIARADGTPDWTPGRDGFDQAWERGRDLLRFHRGEKFRIRQKPGEFGPLRTLGEVHDLLKPRVASAPDDTVFEIRSEADGYAVLLRRHAAPATGGELAVRYALEHIGTPYVFGVTDCSWLTMTVAGKFGISLPHNAHAQHELFAKNANGLFSIPLSKRGLVRPGDFLTHHNDDHISVYMDDSGNGRVIDEEPHGTQGPSGWGYLAPGCQIRPMTPGYYCDWANVNGILRAAAINGAP